MNFKEKQEVRKDQAILEHLVNKYGKDDVLQYINEGRFADFARRVGRGIANFARNLKDWAVNIANAVNSGNVPEGVAIVLADDAAAAAGVSVDNSYEISKIEEKIQNDIEECEAFWDNYIKRANVSESYINRLHRKHQHLNEANFTPEEEFVKLEAPEEMKLMDVNTKDLKANLMFRLRKRMKLGDQIKKGKEDVLLIWGAPGIGKTAIVNSLLLRLSEEAKKHMTLINADLQNKDYDDFFLPAINRNDDGNATESVDLPKSWLPVYKLGTDEENIEGNERANRFNGSEFGGVLFFDEFSRANRGALNTLMKLIDERQLNGYRLGDRWSMVAAANRRVDMADDAKWSWEPAFARRFSQVNFIPTREEWLDWAKNEAHLRSDIIEFVEAYPDHWYEAIINENTAAPGVTPAAIETVSQEWDDMENFDPDWNTYDDETKIRRKIEAAKAKFGERIFREDKRGWEYDMDDYLSVFRHFPKSECAKVWKDGEAVTPNFVQSPGNIAQVVKAVFMNRPNKEKDGVIPTPEEYGNFLKFCMNFEDPSKRQMAIENMKQIIRRDIKGGSNFLPDMPKIGDKENPYYAVSKEITSKLGSGYNKKGGRI